VTDTAPQQASPKHLVAWMNERFPPSHGVLFFVMYATAVLFGRFLAREGGLTVSIVDVVAFVAAWSFFLMLRVFDEHKDYDLDLQNHPDRVLQSGRVTLGHLKVLGVFAIVAQAGVSVWLDGGFGAITTAWLVVIVWSSLMAKEFFVGEWLDKRLVLYALSHMVVMPMALVWMATIGAGDMPLTADVGLLAALSFLSGAAFEVPRKTKGPDEERDTIQSYSQVWGPRGAASIIAALLVGQAWFEVLLLRLVLDTPHWGWYVGLAATFVLPVYAVGSYLKEPSTKGRKLNEGGVSLAMLSAYVLLLAAVISERGIEWIQPG